jgi:hypothetical protein
MLEARHGEERFFGALERLVLFRPHSRPTKRGGNSWSSWRAAVLISFSASSAFSSVAA